MTLRLTLGTKDFQTKAVYYNEICTLCHLLIYFVLWGVYEQIDLSFM